MSDEETPSETNDHLDGFQAYFGDRARAFEAVLAAINHDYPCDLRLTCEACPVQIEGSIDDRHLYFRARWDSWRLAIAPTAELAVRASRMADAIFYHQACTVDGSWIEPAQVDQALRACLTAYRQGERNGGYIEV